MARKWGGLYSFAKFLGIFLWGIVLLAGCGAPSSEDPPASGPEPTDTPKINLAGTWDRNDGGQTLVIGEDGSVISESLALDVATTFRNVIPCDGDFHQLSQTPENGMLSQLKVLIGPHKFTIDDNSQITVDRHRFAQQWVMDEWPCTDMNISGTGRLTSPTTMEIQYLKEPLIIRQTFTYSKTGG